MLFYFQITEANCEDEVSIELHLKTMQDEMKKRKKNMDIIEHRMAITYNYRMTEVRKGTLSVPQILKKYPALKLISCVSIKLYNFFILNRVFFSFTLKLFSNLFAMRNVKVPLAAANIKVFLSF